MRSLEVACSHDILPQVAPFGLSGCIHSGRSEASLAATSNLTHIDIGRETSQWQDQSKVHKDHSSNSWGRSDDAMVSIG